MCSITIIFFASICYFCVGFNGSKSKSNDTVPAQNNDKNILISSTTKPFHNKVRLLL